MHRPLHRDDVIRLYDGTHWLVVTPMVHFQTALCRRCDASGDTALFDDDAPLEKIDAYQVAQHVVSHMPMPCKPRGKS